MKLFNFCSILFVFLSVNLYSQAPPQQINYQGTLRNASGVPVPNQNFSLRFQISETQAGNPVVVYNENQALTSNALGLFSTNIGKFANLSVVNWANTPVLLEVLIDPAGGSNFVSMGTQQMASVPYALYAANSGNNNSYVAGNNITVSGSGPVYTISSTPSLSLNGTALSLSGSNTVTLPSYTGGSNINVTAPSSGNTYTISSTAPNYVAGSNISIASPSVGNTFTISSNPMPFNVSINAPHTVATTSTSANITVVNPVITGQGIATVNSSGNSYQVNVPAATFSTSGNNLIYNQGSASQTIPLPASGWNLNGNAGTSVSNYFGTSDAMDVSFRTNSVERMRLFQNGGVFMGSGLAALNGSALTIKENPDLTFGQAAIHHSASGFNSQAFLSFASGNAAATRRGFIGDYSSLDQDVYVHGESNLRLGAGGNYTNSALFIDGISNNVGIGTLFPSTKLHVADNTANAAGFFSNGFTGASSTAAGVEGQTFSSGNTAAGVKGNNSGSGPGVYGFNTVGGSSSSAHGVRGLTNSTGAQAAGVYGTNQGVGMGVYGANTAGNGSGDAHGVKGETNGTAVNAAGVLGINTGGGSGVYGSTGAAASNAYGVGGLNTGVGPGVNGINTSNVSSPFAHGVLGQTGNPNTGAAGVAGYNTSLGSGLYGINTYSISSSTAHGVQGTTSNPNTAASGVLGSNSGQGSGVSGFNSFTGNSASAHGVFGQTQSSSNLSAGVSGNNIGNGHGVRGTTSSGTLSAAGVFAENTGPGPSVLSVKTGSSGLVGKFEITNSGNSADAVQAVTQGAGAAIHATNTGTSNLSVWMEGGHLRSSGPLPNLGTVTTNLLSFSSMPSLSSNSTDVRGAITFGINGITIGTNAYVEIPVIFAKPYNTAPYIVLTSASDLNGLSYRLVSTTTNDFTIRLYNSANPNGSGPTNIPNGVYKLNYIVIE